MPAMQFGLSAYERDKGGMARTPVVNLYAEEAPTEEGTVALQSRYGLTDRSADMGAGPVEALFKADGVLSGALLGVSDGNLYSGTTSLGSVTGSGAVSITGNEIGAVVTAGATPRYYNGTTLADIAFPDSANVIKVLEGASRFIFIREGGGQFYWSPALAATVDALDFATAETQADKLLDALFIDDILVLFGSETVEFWPNTGDSELPFQPLEARVIEKGIKATGCAAVFNNDFVWVDHENVVRAGGGGARISNAGLEEKIAASTNVRVFTYFSEGQEFLCVRLDTRSYIFGAHNRLWSENASYGLSNWAAQCYAGGVFGSAVDGRTFQFSTGFVDLGGVLERRMRAGFPIDGGGVNIANVRLRANPGHTPNLTGDYADPTVEMRHSRNLGETWSNWRGVSMGAQGAYGKKIEWRACGLASAPGFLAEFRYTAPTDFRVSAARVNEAYGGR